jgi:hypothetical protein
MNMPPLVDGISTGEDCNSSDALADELDRQRGAVIPGPNDIFDKPLTMLCYFNGEHLSYRRVQINRHYLE